MKNLNAYTINIISLKKGTHTFEFEVNDAFFEYFGSEILKKGNCSVKVILDKSEQLMTADFDIKGSVGLVCDRSLDDFDFPIEVKEKILYRYGSEEKELSEDLFQITHATESINVAQFIYEFIGFEIPMKKLHPRFRNEKQTRGEVTLVYSSSSEQTSSKEEEEASDETHADPRWAALQKLKNGNAEGTTKK